MTKKIDPLLVKQTIESEGWILHDVYVNAHTKIRATCPKGHETFITWAGWTSKKYGCKECAGQYVSPTFVKSSIESEDWVLHDVYKNAKTPMRVTCNKGHDLDIRWLNWKRGIRCKICAGQIVDPAFVKNKFKEIGYTLLSEYKNSHTKMDFICPLGHKHSMTWGAFSTGNRCGICARKHITYEEVYTIFDSVGYSLISDTYINSKSYLEFICPNGHIHKITLDDFRNGRRCGQCAVTGFNPNKPASLYYLRFDINATPYYKVGITNRTIQERYRDEPLPYTILKDDRYLFGSLAKKDESKILNKYQKYRYKGKPILFSGNTELFTKDVLKLDV